MTDQEFAHSIAEETKKGMVERVMRGAFDHGGGLWRKPGMIEKAIEEQIDSAVYLRVEAMQKRKATDLLSKALGAQDWGLVTQAFNLLCLGNAEGELVPGD